MLSLLLQTALYHVYLLPFSLKVRPLGLFISSCNKYSTNLYNVSAGFKNSQVLLKEIVGRKIQEQWEKDTGFFFFSFGCCYDLSKL